MNLDSTSPNCNKQLHLGLLIGNPIYIIGVNILCLSKG